MRGPRPILTASAGSASTPLTNVCPTDRYVRLACGLDAASAAPITGNRRGGVDEVLDVFVEVQQQSSAQQQ